ncbi:MAG: hypothetical protein ACKOW9_02105 [Candidatus Paceibacterota bacterium]
MEKLKIAGIVVLFGVAGVLGYMLINDKTASPDKESHVAEEQPGGRKMSFGQFMKLNTEPYTCTVSQNFNETQSTGMVYLEGMRIRGDFNTTIDKKNTKASFIMKDGFAYNWSDLYPIGAKVKVDTSTENKDTSTTTSGTYTWNADQIGEYDCVEWKVDESVFTIPANIQFTEL